MQPSFIACMVIPKHQEICPHISFSIAITSIVVPTTIAISITIAFVTAVAAAITTMTSAFLQKCWSCLMLNCA